MTWAWMEMSNFIAIVELRYGSLGGDMTVLNQDCDIVSAGVVFEQDADFLGPLGGACGRMLQSFTFRMRV